MSDLRDPDGTRLLTNDEVGQLAGLLPATVNYYNSLRKRKRKRHRRTPEGLIPAPVRRVKRVHTRADGKPVTINVQLWREDHIREWIEQRNADYPRKRK